MLGGAVRGSRALHMGGLAGVLAVSAGARAEPNEPPSPKGPPPEVVWPRRPADSTPPTSPAPDAVEPAGVDLSPAKRRGPGNWTFDFGVHTYLARSKYFVGGQLGAGVAFFALRFQGGAVWNSHKVERFGTTFLGPYLSPSVWLYPLRSEHFELRGGLGFLAIGLTAIDDSVWYFAGTASGAANYFFFDHVSAFLQVDALPLRTDGFVIGTAPVLAQSGVEVSWW